MKDKSKILTVINTGKKPVSAEHSVRQENVTSGKGGVLPINMSDYLLKAIWDKVFEIRTTEDGLEYLFCNVNLVSQYGITTYADSTTLDLPSIYAGLPIDGQTLYWEEEDGVKVLKAKGGSSGEGGSIEYPLSWSGFSSGSWDGSAAKTIYIPSKVSELTNDSAFITASALSGYLPLTGGTLTGNLYIDGTYAFMPMNSSGYGMYFAGMNVNLHQNHSYVRQIFNLDPSYNVVFATNPMVKDIGYLATQSWVESGYVSELGVAHNSSGTYYQYLTYTKGGVTNKLTLGYASFANGLLAWGVSDLNASATWNTSIGLRSSWFAASASNLPVAAGVNANGVITFMPVYNYGFQLAYLNQLSTGYDSIPHLFFRNYVNGSYKGWYRIVTDGPQMTFQGIDWSNPYMRMRYQANSWYYIQAESDGLWLGISNSSGIRIDSSGNLLVTGGITMYSDERKKTILSHVQLSLREVADAPLIEHYYNSDREKTTHVGSIAQYWAGLNDWFCKMDDEGFYTMEIQNAALASAISVARELLKYETKTDKQIRKLRKRISELEEEVEQLKNK